MPRDRFYDYDPQFDRFRITQPSEIGQDAFYNVYKDVQPNTRDPNLGDYRETAVYLEQTFTGSDIKALIITKGDAEAQFLQTFEDNPNEVAKTLELADQLSTRTGPFADSTSPTYTAALDLLDSYSQKCGYKSSNPTFPLINLTTITVSTFRAKQQVRALGHTNPRGIARGSRTIAGTMILTEFDRDVFWKILANGSDPNQVNNGDVMSAVLVDQLAPFNIVLLFANEYGYASYRYLYDVEFVTNGSVYSIQDMFSENTLSFLASDVTPLTSLDTSSLRANASQMAGKHAKVNNWTQINSGREVAARYRAAKAARDPYK